MFARWMSEVVCPVLCDGECRWHKQYPVFAPNTQIFFLPFFFFFAFGSSEMTAGYFFLPFLISFDPEFGPTVPVQSPV